MNQKLVLHLFLFLLVDNIRAYNPHWVIVFDAGSTKTSMNLFQFRIDDLGLWQPIHSIAVKWKKALSRFDPKNEADRKAIEAGFKKLFNEAGRIITSPREQQITPVFLYATAGLRALPIERARALLNLSKAAIRKSNFDKLFPNEGLKRTEMLSGRYEGLFAWISVNYLVSPNIEEQKANEDFGVLDLGGGSTQISFRPDSLAAVRDAKILPNKLWTFDENEAIPSNDNLGVYAKSFNNYGMMSTVMKFVGAFEECGQTGSCPNKVYESKCLNPRFSGTFKFGPNVFQIKGKPIDNPENRFTVCKARAKSILQKYGAKPENNMKPIVAMLKNHPTKFYGIAGFYYVAKFISNHMPLQRADTDMSVRGSCDGYRMTVDIYKQGAKAICRNVPDGTRNRYASYSCLQAAYVTTLLTDGYQLPGNTKILACKSLPMSGEDSEEDLKVGWPLGVALEGAEEILENHLETIGKK